MISFLSSWVKNLSLALIMVSILEMILPNNNTKKYVKTVMGLYILFSIISPFIKNKDTINLNNINFNIYEEEIQETSSIEVEQASMDKRLDDIYVQELEKDIKQKIEEKGFIVEECNVKANISNNQNDSGIEKIVLKINKKDNEKTDSIENKIVTEIQKIQKVDINIGNKDKNDSNNNLEEKNNVTKTDIKVLTDFIKEEYGVNEKCLKIN